MDFESTLETIVSTLPVDIDIETALSVAAKYLPEGFDFSTVYSTAQDYMPTEMNIMSMAKFLLLFSAISLLTSTLGRVVLGKRSSLNHSLSSAMGILFVYAVTIMVYTFNPWNLEQFLSPLPFLVFAGDCIMVIPFQGGVLSIVCHEILSLVILAFLANLLDSFIPKGKGIVSWYLLRFMTVLLAMALHFAVSWAFDTYLPNVLVRYAPIILLGLLAVMLVLGVLNVILGAILAIVDPIMGALYTFFFSTIIGKQLTKAVFTTIVLCAVVFVLGYFGFTLISVTNAALLSYIPMAAVMLVLWYIIGHVL